MVERSAGITDQQIYEMIMQSQYWPPEQMRDFQRSQIGQLLRHAKANVPFYESRLDCMFRSDGSIDWSRWTDIPILTRADLRNNRDAMQSRKMPDRHGRTSSASSSGSTGIPITVSTSSLVAIVNAQTWRRFFETHKVKMNAVWGDFKFTLSDGSPPTQEFWIQSKSKDGHVTYNFNDRVDNQRKIQLLSEQKVEVLLASPSVVEILARENLRQGKKLRLSTIIGIGMALTEEQRLLSQQSFGANAISPYSSKEGALMAFECPECAGFHVNAETTYLECVDKNDQACPPDQEGRVVVTSIFNAVQPLIRYDQGDVIIIDRMSRCKRTLPLIKKILGRHDPIFRFPGREFATASLPFEQMRDALGADLLQIAQVDHLALEVRYVSAQLANLHARNFLSTSLQSMFGTDISISFSRLSDIPPNKGGKRQRYVLAMT